jgi:hypothetical protein
LTCAGAFAFAAPPPKKEAMLLCPLIAARKAVQVPRERALEETGGALFKPGSGPSGDRGKCHYHAGLCIRDILPEPWAWV